MNPAKLRTHLICVFNNKLNEVLEAGRKL